MPTRRLKKDTAPAPLPPSPVRQWTLEKIGAIDEELTLTFLEPAEYDQAIIGLANETPGQDLRVVYDYEKLIAATIAGATGPTTYEEAQEYVEYNILNTALQIIVVDSIPAEIPR